MIQSRCTNYFLVILCFSQEEKSAEDSDDDDLLGMKTIYLESLYKAEQSVAKHLVRLAKSGRHPLADFHANPEQALNLVTETGLKLNKDQKLAVSHAITSKVLIITGGPG
jgi:exodeoxyribonuclease V alpha subunit